MYECVENVRVCWNGVYLEEECELIRTTCLNWNDS